MEDNKQGHRKRLMEKFLLSGLSGFHDYEVIELLLTIATPRKDCKEPAKEALKRFKTLQGVIEAPPALLCSIKGIGPKNLFGIKLIKSVADRYLQKKVIKKDPVKGPDDLMKYLKMHIRDKAQESFVAVFLDSQNKVIDIQTLFNGTLTEASIYPREVIKAALSHNAASLIFAHNHPSGLSEPSAEDINITRRLVFAGKIMGISVLEHIIIGDDCYFSFANHGLIEKMNEDLLNPYK